MKKIKSIYFNSLRNDAHYEYFMRYRGMVDASVAIQSVVAGLYPAFIARLDAEGKLLNEMHKSDYTKQIAETDQNIDRCLVGMNAVITAALHQLTPEVVAAAESLRNRMKAFGNIARKSYEEELATVTLLLGDLISAEYIAKTSLVGLTDWVNELNAAKNKFQQLLLSRYEESAGKPEGRMTDARRETEAAYRPMVDRINAAAIMSDEPAPLEAFIEELNAIIIYFNDHTHLPAKKDLSVGDHCVVEPIDMQKYTGRPVTPLPAVHYREEGKPTVWLVFAKDFSITYRNNVNVGMAELTIHGKGAYKGQKSLSFHIARELRVES